jgi:hypothetical protein
MLLIHNGPRAAGLPTTLRFSASIQRSGVGMQVLYQMSEFYLL